ncbi:hypothetical protein BGZ73_002722 [Actinomortierella ambigua]|nr:hypothetical protein BGZ73_002722 [Actinomortierella ambigua]
MTTVDATNGEPICIISAVFEHLIPLILTFLASCIGFHIWLAVVVKHKTTEQQMLKWYCLVSIGIPTATTALACILLRDQPYLTSYPRRFYCALADTPVTAGTFAFPLLAVSIPGMVFSLWTAMVLLQHIRSFRQLLNPPRMSGLHVGHSLRLVFFTIVFAVVITMTALERVIYIFQEVPPDSDEEEASVLSDFSGSVVGVAMFLVFGTTNSSLRAIKRLVCCQGISASGSDGCGSSDGSTIGSNPTRRTSHAMSLTGNDDLEMEDVELGGDAVSVDILAMLQSSPMDTRTTVTSTS